MTPTDPFDRTDVIREDALARLAATLDVPEPARTPALWHWTAFLDRSTTASLGPDGHPRASGLVVDPPYPRRMFAGGRMHLTRALPAEIPIRRIARVGPVTEKRGSRGPLAIVTVGFDYLVEGEHVATEEQDLVYLPWVEPETEARPSVARSTAAVDATEDATMVPGDRGDVLSFTTSFSEVALFRFSALTFNGHRIHYDREYAVETEGHEELVVHGPLLIMRLLELLREPFGDDAVASLAFRARSPTYVGRPISFTARVDGRSVALEAREGVRLLMEATAELR